MTLTAALLFIAICCFSVNAVITQEERAAQCLSCTNDCRDEGFSLQYCNELCLTTCDEAASRGSAKIARRNARSYREALARLEPNQLLYTTDIGQHWVLNANQIVLRRPGTGEEYIYTIPNGDFMPRYTLRRRNVASSHVAEAGQDDETDVEEDDSDDRTIDSDSTMPYSA